MAGTAQNPEVEQLAPSTTEANGIISDIVSPEYEAALKYIQGKANNLINQPGKYKARITSANPTKDGSRMVYNFAALTPYLLDQALAHLEAGEFTEAGNVNFTGNSRIGTDYLATKGETVFVLVEERQVTNKETGEVSTGLFAQAITPMPVSAPVGVDVLAMLKARAGK